jgi:hypothetical protein
LRAGARFAGVHPTWLTAFLDLTAGEYDDAVAFWRGVTA